VTAAPNVAEERIARLDEIIERLVEHPDPTVREAVADLVDGIRWVHAEGLRRLTDLLSEEPGMLRRALDDSHVANLLLLHDLVVVDERDRALEALDSMRPYLRSHGGEVELVAVDEGLVRVRLLGACDGCPSSTATLRQGIERALAEHLPGFRGMEVVGGTADRAGSGSGEDPVSFVPAETLVQLEEKARGGERNGSRSADPVCGELRVGTVDDVPPGLHGHLVDNYPVLLVRVEDEIRAFQNTCPGSILPLHLGWVEEGRVRCPWHGCRFDLATGERVGGEGGPSLHRLEVEIANGEVRVRF